MLPDRTEQISADSVSAIDAAQPTPPVSQEVEGPRCGGSGRIECGPDADGTYPAKALPAAFQTIKCPGCKDCKPEFVEKPGSAPQEIDPGAASTSTPEEGKRVRFKANGHLGTVLDEVRGLVRVVWDKASEAAGEPKDSWVQPEHIEAAPTPEQPEEPACERCGGKRTVLTIGSVETREPIPCPDCSTQEAGGEEEWPDGLAPMSPLSQEQIDEAARAAIADQLNEVHMSTKDSATVWGEAAHILLAERDSRLTKEQLLGGQFIEEVLSQLEAEGWELTFGPVLTEGTADQARPAFVTAIERVFGGGAEAPVLLTKEQQWRERVEGEIDFYNDLLEQHPLEYDGGAGDRAAGVARQRIETRDRLVDLLATFSKDSPPKRVFTKEQCREKLLGHAAITAAVDAAREQREHHREYPTPTECGLKAALDAAFGDDRREARPSFASPGRPASRRLSNWRTCICRYRARS